MLGKKIYINNYFPISLRNSFMQHIFYVGKLTVKLICKICIWIWGNFKNFKLIFSSKIMGSRQFSFTRSCSLSIFNKMTLESVHNSLKNVSNFFGYIFVEFSVNICMYREFGASFAKLKWRIEEVFFIYHSRPHKVFLGQRN